MPRKRVAAPPVAQAWVEAIADDPESVSALAVARAHLPAARTLEALRRLRLIELSGTLPATEELEHLLHRSIQFYNPHKERCRIRRAASEAPPLDPEERGVLVWERGGERRAAAERWWRHETGETIEVREGVAWAARFALPQAEVQAALEALAVLEDREHGLLCNPHAQEWRIAIGPVPVPWLDPAAADAGARPAPRRRSR